MKTFVATIKDGDITKEYRVKAEDKTEAQKKIKKICGENLKVKEK